MTGLYSPATANMFPAALVLVLVLGVRVRADSMEAPSGKRTEHAGFGGVTQSAHLRAGSRAESRVNVRD